jgi:hypothetical protein
MMTRIRGHKVMDERNRDELLTTIQDAVTSIGNQGIVGNIDDFGHFILNHVTMTTGGDDGMRLNIDIKHLGFITIGESKNNGTTIYSAYNSSGATYSGMVLKSACMQLIREFEE